MTPKEKAKDLVENYMPHIAGADRYNTTLGLYDKTISKQCALITVGEIIKALRHTIPNLGQGKYKGKGYWSSVKQEIEKL